MACFITTNDGATFAPRSNTAPEWINECYDWLTTPRTRVQYTQGGAPGLEVRHTYEVYPEVLEFTLIGRNSINGIDPLALGGLFDVMDVSGLKKLRLFDVPSVDQAAARRLFRRLPSTLDAIRLCNCPWVDDAMMEDLNRVVEWYDDPSLA